MSLLSLSSGRVAPPASSHFFCVWQHEAELILPSLQPCQVFLIARKVWDSLGIQLCLVSPCPSGFCPLLLQDLLQIGVQIPPTVLGRGHRPIHSPGCAPESGGQTWSVRRCCWWPPACDTCPVSLCHPTSPPSAGAGGGAPLLPEPWEVPCQVGRKSHPAL